MGDRKWQIARRMIGGTHTLFAWERPEFGGPGRAGAEKPSAPNKPNSEEPHAPNKPNSEKLRAPNKANIGLGGPKMGVADEEQSQSKLGKACFWVIFAVLGAGYW